MRGWGDDCSTWGDDPTETGIPADFMWESFPQHRDPLPYSAIRILRSGTSQEQPQAVAAKRETMLWFFLKMKFEFRKFLTPRAGVGITVRRVCGPGSGPREVVGLQTCFAMMEGWWPAPEKGSGWLGHCCHACACGLTCMRGRGWSQGTHMCQGLVLPSVGCWVQNNLCLSWDDTSHLGQEWCWSC